MNYFCKLFDFKLREARKYSLKKEKTDGIKLTNELPKQINKNYFFAYKHGVLPRNSDVSRFFFSISCELW